jgi:hypothetical protein
MIFIVIAIVWIATMSVVVAVCRMAAHGERRLPLAAGRSPNLLEGLPESFVSERLVPERRTFALRLEDRRSKAAAAEHVWDRAQKDLYVRP